MMMTLYSLSEIYLFVALVTGLVYVRWLVVLGSCRTLPDLHACNQPDNSRTMANSE
jgi:hypothetical protein